MKSLMFIIALCTTFTQVYDCVDITHSLDKASKPCSRKEVQGNGSMSILFNKRKLSQDPTSTAPFERPSECTLGRRFFGRFYNDSRNAFVINDTALEILGRDLQRLIDCVEDGGRIMFHTVATIAPLDTIVFSRALTLAGYTDADPTNSTVLPQAEDRVHFTCPSSGGSLFRIRNQNVTISNALIQDCDQDTYTPVVIDSCRSPRERTTVRFNHVDFLNGSNTGNASIILQEGSCASMNFINVTIHGNNCGRNGCIRIEGNASFQNATISNNSVSDPVEEEASVVVVTSGARLYGRNVVASGNDCRSFFVNGSDLHLTGSSLLRSSENASNFRMSMQGGVFTSRNSTVTVENCLFERNTASEGGVLYARDSEVQVTNSTFLQNRASDGVGGVMYVSGSSLIMSRCNCSSNAGPFVSAIGINGSRFYLSHVTVARGSGASIGAVQSLLSDGSVNNSMFLENDSDNIGGGLHVAMSNVDIANSQFLGNTALGGSGGLHVAAGSTVNIQRSSFIGNSGALLGGGIGIYMYNRVALDDSLVSNNTADAGGGIACHAGSNITIRRTAVFNNMATSGGGIGIDNSSRLHAEELTVSRNRATGDGGGLVALSGSMFSVTRSLIEENVANRAAGIEVWNSKVMSYLSSSRIANNRALSNGGGLQLFTSSLEIDDVEFEGNSASLGGGIHAAQSNLTLRHSRFAHNAAIDFGSDVYGLTTNTTLTNSSFLRGRSNGSSGSLHFEETFLNASDISISRSYSQSMGAALTAAFSFVWMNRTEVSFTVNGSTTAVLWLSSTVNAEYLTLSHNNGTTYAPLGITNSTVSMTRCAFFNNSARLGGTINVARSSVSVSETSFRQGFASRYGGCILLAENSVLNVRTCSFLFCTAMYGGAIYAGRSRANIIRSTFIRNFALVAGGVVWTQQSELSFQNSTTRENTARFGGAIWSQNTTASFEGCTILDNVANVSGGAMYLMRYSEARITGCTVAGNSARGGGGIYLHSSSLNSADSTYCHNAAISGGGLYLWHGILLLFVNITFHNNSAVENGGAVNIVSNDGTVIALQLENSTFTRNRARYGGGVHSERQLLNVANCEAPGAVCSGIAIVGTVFMENRAMISGAAVQANDPSVLRFNCSRRPTTGQVDLLTAQEFLSLRLMGDRNLCRSWRRKNQVSDGGYGGVVGSYAQNLDVSFLIAVSQRADQAQNDELSLTNIRSGRQLPTISIVAVDQYGNGPATVVSRNLTVTLSSPDGFFPGIIPLPLIGSIGNFSEVVGFKQPGVYHLMITADDANIDEVEITVNIRECRIGEQPTSDRILCEPCDALSYNFDPDRIGGCNQCPDHSDCTTRFIVPDPGYWHSSPCSNHSKRCVAEVACETINRTVTLKELLASFLSCDLGREELESYWALQCKEGYTGVLCGSCENDYGRYWSFECAKCLHSFFSVAFVIFLMFWLLVLTIITVRGNLPYSTKITKKLEEGKSSDDASPTAGTSTNVPRPGSSSSPRGSTSNSPLDETRWYTTELFKITINFVQVIAIAARLNVEWTSSISGFLETAGYLGGASTEAMTQSVDCLSSSDSSIPRPVLRYLVSLLVPIVVVCILALFWMIRMKRSKNTMSFFWKRVMLSTIAVAYISYTGMTEAAIRVFSCVNVFDSPTAKNLYWTADTSVQCFEGNHIALLWISIGILVFLTIGFPSFSLLMLVKYLKSSLLEEHRVFETVGFLYRAFDRRYAFWESFVMFRKASLSAIAVFAYPLGAEIQADLAVLILVICLFCHLVCRPYKEDFRFLNSYEAVSLLLSIATFILAQFFEHAEEHDSVKIALTLVLFPSILGFIVFMLVMYGRSMVKQMKMIMDAKGTAYPSNARWWTVVLLYISSTVKCCGKKTTNAQGNI